jgi:hypothetical protein
MKYFKFLLIALGLFLVSCGSQKSYFTVAVRDRLEENSVPLNQLQFYVDRDVELRRELTSGNIQVSSGKVKFENGKYIHIILLKRNTPGICTTSKDNKLDISFETGDGKFLTFGVATNAAPEAGYQIFAREWINSGKGSGNEFGKIMYDNQEYYIQPGGAKAKIMIRKSVVAKFEVKKRVMKGRKVQQ